MCWLRSIVSLLVLLACMAALAQPSPTQAEEMRRIRQSPAAREQSVREALEKLENAPQGHRQKALEHLRSTVRLYELRRPTKDFSEAPTLARRIKSSALYRDAGITESSNWLSRALDRLKNLLKRPQRQESPDWKLPRLGPWVTRTAWVLLGLAIAVFAYYALKHYQWKVSLARKASAMLEEDEPERTLDEWLDLADRLEAEGDVRRAVRCLYLACLLRFDEAGIARFDRGQTNWEHLQRIEGSSRMPIGLDFRNPTRAFDIVWYGKVVRGPEDIRYFRDTYARVKESTQLVPA